jgi:AAA domain/Primase C terminal 2 (PriCT-2)/RepB DNA-primase from phage plasmid
MSALPSFDRSAIETHVSLLHDLAAGIDGILLLAAFEEGGLPNVQRFSIGDVTGMVETIMGFDGHPRVNLYIPWAVMRRDLEPCKKGTEADVVAVLAAVPDLDNDKYQIGELPIEAPYIVESSPGNFQPAYVFKRPLMPAMAKPVLTAISDFIGGDSGTKDCSHVWRIPGTLNIPTKSKLARGRSPVPAAVAIKKHYDGRLIDPSRLLALAPPPRRPNGHDTGPISSLSGAEETRLREALRVIPADDRDIWLKAGAALHLVGARAVWDDWSKTSGKFDAADQDRVWASFHGERKDGVVTIATIYAWAKERGWVPSVNAEEPQKPIVAKPYVYRDPRSIPPRQWLHAGHYVRGFLSATIGPGGLGKTSLELVEAAGMVVGRDLIRGTTSPRKLRVWYWNLEDPQDEIDRRIAAILLHYKIDPAEIEGSLFVNCEEPLVIATRVHDATVVAEPVINGLVSEIRRLQIDALIVDPFVSSHKVPENDNGAIDTVAAAWSGIGRECNCAVELAHHIRKPSSGSTSEITVDDARGAGSLKDKGRSVRVLNVMSKEEAEKVGIKPEQRRRYFRVDDGKTNMKPPAETVDWRQLVSVPLDNPTEDTEGDWVGVLTAWKMPGALEGITANDLLNVQKHIAEGKWREDPRAAAWAGKAVAKTLGLDVREPPVRKRIQGMIRVWLGTGALRIVTGQDETRHEREFVEVGEWAV